MSTTPTDADASRRPSAARRFRTLLWREWRLELHTRETLIATGVFAAIVVMILSFSVAGSDAAQRSAVQSALLWITFAFATTLGLGRAFAREREAGAMTGLLLAPIDWSLIYAAKLVATVAITLATQLATLALFGLFLGLALSAVQVAQLAGLLLLVTTGHVAVGLVVAGLTVGLRAREVLLPVLLFPLLIPLFLAALRATALVLDGFVAPGAWMEFWRWTALAGLFDGVYLVLGVLLFPWTMR